MEKATLTEDLNNIASRIQLENVELMFEINLLVDLGDNQQAKSKLLELANAEDMQDGTETICAKFIRNVANDL